MIDNLLAFKILWMLVTPFKDTSAFKLGIVDETGKLLKPVNDLKAGEERDAYNVLVRLVFNLKRMLNKLPGGESKLKNFAAAYFLIKENIDVDYDEFELECDFNAILREEKVYVDEMVELIRFLKLYEDAPVNATGPAVSSNEPVVNLKKKRKLRSIIL